MSSVVAQHSQHPASVLCHNIAKTAVEFMIKGADEYLSKPDDIAVVVMRYNGRQ